MQCDLSHFAAIRLLGVDLRLAGDLSHLALVKGGGVKMTTPSNSKTERDRKARDKLSIALNEYIRKSFFRAGQY